jgi:hypothetical protein
MANEKRLIDLDVAIERAKASDNIVGSSIWETSEVVEFLEDCPIEDAVEVVHGRWKYYHKQNIAVCTNCSFERDLDANFGRAISCPNCGAMMDGDGNG